LREFELAADATAYSRYMMTLRLQNSEKKTISSLFTVASFPTKLLYNFNLTLHTMRNKLTKSNYSMEGEFSTGCNILVCTVVKVKTYMDIALDRFTRAEYQFQ
jgi:hypothetical protein